MNTEIYECVSLYQKLHQLFTSREKFEAIQKESRQWFLACTSCGHQSEKSIWEMGGIRYKATSAGKRTSIFCSQCQRYRRAKFIQKI